MTMRSDATRISRLRPALALLAGLSGLTLSGCSTIDDADLAAADKLAETRTGAPADTGTFPNLNIPPPPAPAQLSEDEKKRKLAALKAAQKGQSPPSASTESAEAKAKRLKLLATQQSDTLDVIENN